MYTIPHSTTRSISETTPETIQDKVPGDHVVSSTIILNRSLSPSELSQVRSDVHTYCQYYDMSTSDIDPYHIRAVGTSRQHANAFKVNMVNIKTDKGLHHETTKPISIPASWKDKVQNILGYDTKQIARPYFKKSENFAKDMNSTMVGGATPAIATPAIVSARDGDLAPRGDIGSNFYPTTLARLYNFPTNLDGTGQKIGIIELGGGFVTSDITTYFSQLGISGTPNVTAVGVDGAVNNPSDPSGASVEVILDIEVIAAIVPKAAILVYFGPNSYQGFYDAINAAINANCNIISISWGAPESSWSQSMLNSYNTLFQTASTRNISVFAAAGDNGSSDGASGNNVDFPASSPYVCACGGTTLSSNNNTTINTEVVWNNNSSSSATGGGKSTFFTKPSYQSSVSYSLGNSRGVPDVAGDADPNTGYILYGQSEGGWIVVGGTSAVSPLWSGLIGRINQSLGRSIGFVQPTLYANTSAFRDITQGNNGAYSAGTGWDPCTGNGTPNGQSVLTAFGSPSGSAPVANFSGTPVSGTAPLTVTFTDTSTNTPTGWSWNFGNSTSSTLQNPSCVYSTAGIYTVSLTATNGSGSNTFTRTNYITVTSTPVNVATAFTGTPTTGNAPLAVNFTDQSTGSPTSWSWSFGDTTTSTSQNPSHTYNSAGTYTVSLTATNGSSSNTLTKTNYITVNSTTLTSAFTGTPTSGNAPLTVSFTNQTTGNPVPTSWQWSFGDTTTSTTRNPSHTYTNPGNYTVSLVAGNGSTTNTLTKTNYITAFAPPVNANFTSNVTTGRVPLRVSFRDLTSGSTSWFWNFGNGASSTLKNPVSVYSRPGTFSVSLTVTTPRGSSTVTKSAYIRATN